MSANPHTILETPLYKNYVDPLYLFVTNPINNPPATVSISLEVPDGMIIEQTSEVGWVSSACTKECSAEIHLNPGETNREIYVLLRPQKIGEAEIIQVDHRWEVVGNLTTKPGENVYKSVAVAEIAEDEKSMHLKSDRLTIREGENAVVDLTVSNVRNKGEMTANVQLIVPSGFFLTGFSQEVCHATCEANYTIPEGADPKLITIHVKPNKPGEFDIEAEVRSNYQDDQIPYGDVDVVKLTVHSATVSTQPTPMPVPTPTVRSLPTPTPTAIPTPVPAPTPPPPPTAVSGSGSGSVNQPWYITPLVIVGIAIPLLAFAVLLGAVLSRRNRARGADDGPNQESDQAYYSGIRPPR